MLSPVNPSFCLFMFSFFLSAHNYDIGSRSAIGRAPDSEVRGPGFDTRSGNILSFRTG